MSYDTLIITFKRGKNTQEIAVDMGLAAVGTPKVYILREISLYLDKRFFEKKKK